ncbi:LLM class flavin-dependent oxidoreductase [Aminobacter anthyllidis]|uniref:LLM class flavin-dependent oxidoreductase n=1 Tax=Aminobacter anthyllidis TaxID=1035067 RepID=A0A9X1AHE8_9HYPH|nr:LLM class flavin-dependent oxidoreductase [Aminobacter anthyllidis]MBT1159658.1 LLM class flavin-dependent oxidoreductase [Aminobacter anthyllidis]
MRKILLNAFNMNSVGHIAHGLWRHPRDNSVDYTNIEYWTDLAKLLEKGMFDGVFMADVIGINDVYGSSPEAACEKAVQVPINDPMLIVSAMAAVTNNLGFGVTSNLTYESPYLLARRFSTLDHLTKGRVGWNVVTGYLDSAARGLGLTQQIEHSRRYDMADDYMDCVYKLWERSWEDGSVLRNRETGVFADTTKVHTIEHSGPFVKMSAAHLCEPSPQRTPVLYQAGSSPRGQAFAGKHAECVFITGRTPSDTAKLVADIRNAAAAADRNPRGIRVFLGVVVIVGKTNAEAHEKLEEYKRYASPEGGLVHLCSSTGIDYSKYDLDEPITFSKTESMVSVVEALTTRNAGQQWTVRKLLKQMEIGCRMAPIVGDPMEVADALETWVREADVDGFNLIRTVTPESFADFVELVVPELQNRGVYKTEYAHGTLREKLFDDGAYLPSDHVGSRFHN